MRTPRSYVLLAGIACTLGLLAGCGGCQRIDPEGPLRVPPPPRTEQPALSSLSIPIAIPVDELQDLVNQVIPQQLYAEKERPLRKGIVRARLDLDLQRNGNVRITTSDGLIITHIPLRADGRVRLVRGIVRSFSTTFTVHAVSDLRLDEHWETTATTRSSFTWREKPTIGILGFDVDISGQAEPALNRQLAQLAPRIDRLIEERVTLRWRVEKIWESLAEPVPVREQPPVWLTVQPMDAFFVPGLSQEDTLVFGLGVNAYVETVVGDEPPSPRLGALPPLRILPDSLVGDRTHQFSINLPVALSYEDANALLAETLADKDFALHDDVTIRLDEIEMYGHESSLVARVDFSARVSGDLFRTRGRVFLTGTPVYDPTTQHIRLDDFTYDVRSEYALAETADWFFGEEFIAHLRPRLTLPLADRIDTAQAQLQEALQHRALGRHILLDGTITDLVPGALYLTADGLTVNVSAHGLLTARVHALDDIRRRSHPDSTGVQN